MRACDHQMLTPGYVAELVEPDKIPADIRWFATEFPFLGKATPIPREEMTVPPQETGNKRCEAATAGRGRRGLRAPPRA